MSFKKLMERSIFAQIFYWMIWLFTWPIFKFFTDFEVNLPPAFSFDSYKKPLILVSNHSTLMDSFLIGLAFPIISEIHPLYFFTADQWINSPFGPIIEVLGSIPNYRGQGLEVSLHLPRQIIKNNGAIIIFPQGKRYRDFDASQGKIGAAVLALTTKTPVLPLAISDPSPGNIVDFFLMRRKIKVSIGQSFSLSEKYGKKENYTKDDFIKATAIIMEEIRKLM